MNKKELTTKIDEVLAVGTDGSQLTAALNAWKESLVDKRAGRKPGEYDFLQERINEQVPNMKAKFRTAHSVARKVRDSFLLEGNTKVYSEAHIKNLINEGSLIIPVVPEVVEVVEAEAVTA